MTERFPKALQLPDPPLWPGLSSILLLLLCRVSAEAQE